MCSLVILWVVLEEIQLKKEQTYPITETIVSHSEVLTMSWIVT